MTTPSASRCCSVLCDGRLMAGPPLVEARGVEARDVVHGALLERELREGAPDPGRELVARAAPADADVGAGDAGDRAEDEVVVGDEVVVAAVRVGDVLVAD